MGQGDQVNHNLDSTSIKKQLHVLLVVEELVNEHKQPISLLPILTLTKKKGGKNEREVCSDTTNLLQLVDYERSVIERSYLLVALPIHNSHCLQTHGLHGGLWGEEEPMVQVIEKLQSE